MNCRYVKDRKDHDLRCTINPNKIDKKLEWKHLYNFQSAIKQTINCYLNNKEWVEKILSREYLRF